MNSDEATLKNMQSTGELRQDSLVNSFANKTANFGNKTASFINPNVTFGSKPGKPVFFLKNKHGIVKTLSKNRHEIDSAYGNTHDSLNVKS